MHKQIHSLEKCLIHIESNIIKVMGCKFYKYGNMYCDFCNYLHRRLKHICLNRFRVVHIGRKS